MNWLRYDCVAGGVFPFVLTGLRTDRALVDKLNRYTGESGADGLVRTAAANPNYGLIRLVRTENGVKLDAPVRTQRTAFGVLHGFSHSDVETGVARSVRMENASSH